MFKGQFDHSVDPKGRASLPAAFRRELEDNGEEHVVIAKHVFSKCLMAHPASEWRILEGKLAELPRFDPTATWLRRNLVGSAQEVPIDKVGRCLLPAGLRDFAGIEDKLVWMGQLQWIEIWAPGRLEQAEQALPADIDLPPSVLEALAKLGL